MEVCLTFPVNMKWFRVLVRCSAATKGCRLIHGINLEHRKNIFENQFSTFDAPRDFPRRISSDDVQRNREAALGDPKLKTSLKSEDGQNYGTIPLPTFASKPLTTSCTIPVDVPQNYVVGQQRQQISRNCDSTNSLIHHHFWCLFLKCCALVFEAKASFVYGMLF